MSNVGIDIIKPNPLSMFSYLQSSSKSRQVQTSRCDACQIASKSLSKADSTFACCIEIVFPGKGIVYKVTFYHAVTVTIATLYVYIL